MSRSFRLPFRSRRRIADDIDEELAFHLSAMAAQLRDDGWSPEDAVAEARRRFGNVAFTRDYCRAEDVRREKERNRMAFADELTQDLRYAVRGLRAAPAFTLVALATLALGIGANTAIFSVVRSVLLEPLPFATADRIVRVWDTDHAAGVELGEWSEPDFLDIRNNSTLTEQMGGFFFGEGQTGIDMTGDGAPEHLSAALVTPGFFETLRPRAIVGRVLSAEEHELGHNRSVVIGYGFWQRRFGGDPRVVGRSITLNGDPFTVVGVMERAFTYPAAQRLDVWFPLSYFGPDYIGRGRGARFLKAVARLKPGVAAEQFRAEVAGVTARLARTYPENAGWDNASVQTIRESIVGDVRRPLVVLVIAVALVLLITCANIAGLLLARASTRQRELAVRAALGAGRARIIRQLITESLVLALAGGAGGVVLAVAGVRALAAQGGAALPGAGGLTVDTTVLAFTFLITIIAGLVCGALPAVRAAGPALEQSLRAGTRGSVGARGQRTRSALVVGQVALAVVLAAAASLATKSFARLIAVNPGFDAAHALVVRVSTPASANTRDLRVAYYENVLNAVRAVPGVIGAGSIRDLPTRGEGESVRPDQWNFPRAERGVGGLVQLHHVSPGFFKVLGVPVRSGRELASTDRPGAPPVVLINETAAKRFWPGENPVGRALHVGATEIRIVGVVGDIRQSGPSEPVAPAMYISALQNQRSAMSIVIRATGDPEGVTNAVRAAVWSVDPNEPITEVTTLEKLLGGAITRPRLLAWLLGTFGLLGLVLGALGIYGLLAFAVAQRQQEIGVRVALGAPRTTVLRLVMEQGVTLALAGVLVGVVLAQLFTRQMQAVLFGIAPGDVATLVEVIVVLLGTALLASWLPARRALAIDPVAALRGE